MDDEHILRGDLEWGTTPKLVLSQAAKYGDHPAILDHGVNVSYAELAVRVERAARAFVAAGLEPGERAAIWAPNIWEWAVVALGLHAAGGVLVPLNTRFKGQEAAYVLESSGARLLFTVSGFLDTDYVELLHRGAGGPGSGLPVAELARLEQIVLLRGDSDAGGTVGLAEFMEHGGSVDSEVAIERAAAVRPEDLSDILFTSGTTGRPKGVMTSHGQNLRAFSAWASVIGLHHGDRYLAVNPFFHAFGYKAGILASLMTGAALYPEPVFDVPAVMRRIAHDSITMLPGPPTLYQTILNHPDLASFDMSSLRLAVTGAAAIPVELILRMRKELSFDVIVTGYGLTEACGIATMCRFDDDPETIALTSGRAIPDVEVEIHDDGAAAATGEPGEVVVRGYNVMRGYLDDPGETAEAVDGDGWLHTGDIGTMDARGYIKITDRKKDMFIVGGFNAYPAEIENLLLGNATIAQVAVVGVPDERMGEVGCAFVVPRPDARVDPDELIAWSRERMANYKVPRRVIVVSELPMNATGKVLKYELRALATLE